jgi:formylglycine-generating enzyme required for sulfatase activity
VAALALVSCATLAGIDTLQIGACMGGGDCGVEGGLEDGALDAAGPDSPPDVTLPPCTSDAGPTMIRAGGPANNFCIDSTEVTVAQYRAFLEAGVPTTGQVAQCTWNSTYTANVGGADDLPQTGVDWCDAYAYCQWAGKVLCGRFIGGKPSGSVGLNELGDLNVHAWYIACSAQGQVRFPYGNVEQEGACNVDDSDAAPNKAVAVKSYAKCVGGYPGIYDMVGNVWEWFDGPFFPHDAGTDAADAQPDGSPAHQDTFVKGGSFANQASVDCRTDGRNATRDYKAADVGIRCCSP